MELWGDFVSLDETNGFGELELFLWILPVGYANRWVTCGLNANRRPPSQGNSKSAHWQLSVSYRIRDPISW